MCQNVALCVNGLINPGISLSYSAAALTVSGDHHGQSYRRRHLSGFSTEDEDEPQHVLEIIEGHFSWDLEKKETTLKNINLQVNPGEEL